MKEFKGLRAAALVDEIHHGKWALRLSKPKTGPELPALSPRMRVQHSTPASVPCCCHAPCQDDHELSL